MDNSNDAIIKIESIKCTGSIPDVRVELIDQTRLPGNLVKLIRDDYRDIVDDIQRLAVRGAPAIAIAGAMGAVLGVQKSTAESYEEFESELIRVIDELKSIRPTAVNLFWVLDRVLGKCRNNSDKSISFIKEIILQEAIDILEEDKILCKRIGEFGQEIVKDGDTILTHCNTGALATGGTGTAISIMYHARKAGKIIKVYADETRPLLQGARLTAWELINYDIDVVLICDSAAAMLMKNRIVDYIIVGADHIAMNGDTANKIGTYGLSVLAKAHNIPFYIAAPFSTFDTSIVNGDSIQVEERSGLEVTAYSGVQIAPENANVYNPAFDITPGSNITAFITDKGIIYPPYEKNLSQEFLYR